MGSRRRPFAAALIVASMATRPTAGAGPADHEPDRVAAIRLPAGAGSPTPERDRLIAQVEAAARAGADFVVLPEFGDPSAAEPIPGPTTEWFGNQARRLGVSLIYTLRETAESPGTSYVTTVAQAADGRILQTYRKVLPRPDADGSRPARGDPKVILESYADRGRRYGIVSGDDIQTGVPRLASRGAGTIFVTAAWAADDPVDWARACRDLSRDYRVHLVIADHGPAGAPGGIYRAETGDRVAAGPVGAAGGIARADLPRTRPPGIMGPVPLGLPPLPVPTDEPTTPALIELGRRLFFDPSLSSDGSVSCATCHRPDRAFADGRRVGMGVGGRTTQRNTPSLLNVAYRAGLFWDAYAGTLESQSKYPMSHHNEMNVHYLDTPSFVNASPRYRELAASIRPEGGLDHEDIARALASYERTLLSGDSPFDRSEFGGDRDALTAEAARGLTLFRGKARCALCHAIEPDHALFMDHRLHNTGVGLRASDGASDDAGAGMIGYGGMTGMFLTPSLRDVAETAPYMHDGSLETLEKVVEHYDRGGGENPHLDPLIRPLGLTARDRADLVAFLVSLTGSDRYSSVGRRIEPGRVAVPRIASVSGEVGPNRREIARRVEAASREGAEAVLLPEHAETGPVADSGAVVSRTFREIAAGSSEFHASLAREYGIWVIASALEETAEGGWPRLSIEIHRPDGTRAYRAAKVTPRPDLGDPPAAPGQIRTLRAVDLPFGRAGVISGDDLRQGIPRLAELGAATVFVSASWGTSDGLDWIEVCRDLANRHRVDVIINNLDPGEARPETVAIRGADPTRVRALDEPANVRAVAIEPREPDPPPALGLPAMPAPTDRPTSPTQVALGRRLFFDPGLSADGRVSCATCHRPEAGFAGIERTSPGVYGRLGRMNVPSLLNSGYKPHLFWDGRADSLENQVQFALLGWAEMDADPARVVRDLERSDEYRRLFRTATGRERIELDDIARAIAQFERTLVSGGSAFDRHRFGGEDDALSPAAARGLALFEGRARCTRCHLVGLVDASFTDFAAHNTGVGYHERFDYLGYSGDGLEGNPATKNTFRGEYITPTLRDVALTAPYMHDGSLPTLADVVDFYNAGCRPNPFLDEAIAPLNLSRADCADLVAFLHALTGEVHPETRQAPESSGAARDNSTSNLDR